MLFFENYATVEDVINFKQSENPEHDGLLKIPMTATLLQLIDYMADHQVGVVFLHDADDQIIGLISERDIIRHIAMNALEAFEKPIHMMVRHSVITCKRGDKLKAVASHMAEQHIRHVAILSDKGEYIGVVSSSDIELFAGKG
ncbi:hypothetical protein GCM10011332_19660 [Terasakiella brassicae]|uniref:CBS domain-containing protein n=1 Tax=Terasakiella brassicae TaxID=1634917 RepID=A0A917C1M0_9PROT|nr:CBS domain-containing protein [Terasakiella brassicae]GGF65639.1 hypothetical protein GCM10011332_19660 [Terasakiella brassicae]